MSEVIRTHLMNVYTDCTLCPRNCHVNRLAGETGYCGQTAELTAARASLHMWEEPCISGLCGSGTVFFSGCNLKCVFCQNHEIATGLKGQSISASHLARIFLTLQDKGANNINLITPSHFIPQIRIALETAKKQGLFLPIVYNTGSYEHVDTLKQLDGLVDIYLPDLKYYSSELSMLYSHAPDYFERATAAIAEMYRQTGSVCFYDHNQKQPEPNTMKQGVIVRHLLLPGQVKDSKKVLRYLHNTYGNHVYISIMNQYTPLPHVKDISPLNRKVTPDEYQRLIDFAIQIGIENGFYQYGEVANESFIPDFNGEGL